MGVHLGNIHGLSSCGPLSRRAEVQGSCDFALCGTGMPVEVTGEDDVFPSER